MTLLSAALADRTAAPIVAAFFSVFHKYWEGELTPEDLAILKCLRSEIDDHVKERNRLMHDAWMSTSTGADAGPHPLVRFRVRAHGKGVEFQNRPYPPKVLEDLAQDLLRLSSVVSTSVWYRRPNQKGPELHLRMQIIDGKVTRTPPN